MHYNTTCSVAAAEAVGPIFSPLRGCWLELGPGSLDRHPGRAVLFDLLTDEESHQDIQDAGDHRENAHV